MDPDTPLNERNGLITSTIPSGADETSSRQADYFRLARDSGTAQVTTRRLAFLSALVCAPLRVRSARKTSASRWDTWSSSAHPQPPCLGRVKGSRLAASVRSSHADLPKGHRSLARQDLLKRPTQLSREPGKYQTKEHLNRNTIGGAVKL